MKKFILCLGLVAIAVGVGLSFYFGKTETSKISLMEEAVASVEAYNDGGEASETIQKLESLSQQLSDLNKKSPPNSADGDPETKAKADRLRGELANASLELEISEKPKAQDVSKALDQFIGQ